MLDLVERQQALVERRSARLVPWILFSWGVAWVLGYGALWLTDGLRPAFALPGGVAMSVFFGLFAAAVILSAVLGARSDRGVRGTKESAFTGTVFGIGCFVALGGIHVVGLQLAALGMPVMVANVYFPVIYTLVIGFIYLMAAAVRRAVPCVVIGALLIGVALAAGFFAFPTPYLVIGVGGGAVFVGGGVTTLAWVRGRAGARR